MDLLLLLGSFAQHLHRSVPLTPYSFDRQRHSPVRPKATNESRQSIAATVIDHTVLCLPSYVQAPNCPSPQLLMRHDQSASACAKEPPPHGSTFAPSTPFTPSTSFTRSMIHMFQAPASTRSKRRRGAHLSSGSAITACSRGERSWDGQLSMAQLSNMRCASSMHAPRARASPRATAATASHDNF